MGARQEDLWAARLLAYVIDVGAHPFALTKAFARQQLVATRHRLGPPEIDDDIAELDPLHQAVNDFADPVLEFEELPLTLGVAHFLHDNLFGGLCCDPTEIDWRERIGDEVTNLRLRIQMLRLGERDLGRLVLDRLGHLAEAQQPDLAVNAVDLGANIVFLPVFGAARLLDRLLHCLEHLVAIDTLVTGNGVGDLEQLGAGVDNGAFHGFLGDALWFRASVPSGGFADGKPRSDRRSERAAPAPRWPAAAALHPPPWRGDPGHRRCRAGGRESACGHRTVPSVRSVPRTR